MQDSTASTFCTTTRQPQLQQKQTSGSPDRSAITGSNVRSVVGQLQSTHATELSSFLNLQAVEYTGSEMDPSHRLAMETNYALMKELQTVAERMQDIQVELDDVELAIKEDQEEVETYTDDIADCCDRINAIDEFVSDIEAGNIPTMTDVASVVVNMAEEREEEEAMLKRLGEVRACHEEQLHKMNTQLMTLQDERLMLQKKSAQIWCVLGRTGVFELVIRQLAERTAKTV